MIRASTTFTVCTTSRYNIYCMYNVPVQHLLYVQRAGTTFTVCTTCRYNIYCMYNVPVQHLLYVQRAFSRMPSVESTNGSFYAKNVACHFSRLQLLYIFSIWLVLTIDISNVFDLTSIILLNIHNIRLPR